MTPHELQRSKIDYQERVARIAQYEASLILEEKQRVEVREQLIKWYIKELLNLGITADELAGLLVQTKLEQT